MIRRKVGDVALFVWVQGDIAGAALKLGKHRELAVYLWVTHLDAGGNARVKLEDLEAFVIERGYISVANLHRRLERGSGTFWDLVKHKKGTTIVCRSLGRVAAALKTLPFKSDYPMPLDAFETLQLTKWHLYAAWHSDAQEIARATVTEVTGVTRRSQYTYERGLRERGIEIRKGCNVARKPRVHRSETVPAGGFETVDKKGRAWIWKRLPNTMQVMADVIRRGSLKRQRRTARGILSDSMPAFRLRRYFRDPKRAARSKSRERTFYVDTRRSLRGGRRIWDQNSVPC